MACENNEFIGVCHTEFIEVCHTEFIEVQQRRGLR